MAGKNAYLRLQIIDRCLNKKAIGYNLSELKDAVEEAIEKELSKYDTEKTSQKRDQYTISDRTLRNDLRILKNTYNAPINRPNVYDTNYRYTSPFHLSGIAVPSEESKALDIGLAFLHAIRDTEYATKYKSVLNKILEANGENSNEQEFIQIERANGDAGIKWFDTIYNAIEDYVPILIEYKPFNGKVKEWLISPYLLKEYHNKWYVVGFNQNINQIFTLGLDRIIGIQKINDKKIKFRYPPLQFDRQTYFEHSLGITRLVDIKPLDLVLKFNALNMHYVLAEPWHHSQKTIKQTAHSLTVSLCVYESHELNMKILSYGDGIEVLKPLKYRNTIKAFIEKMKNIYEK